MNYIELINNFWKADIEYSFTGNETKLYMFLLHTSNSLGWKNPFRLSYRQIELGANLTVNTVKSARNKLKQSGLIDFIEGKKGNAKDFNNKSVYEIRLSKFDNQTGNHMGNQSDNQTGNQSDNQTDDIDKQETINLNINNNIPLLVPQVENTDQSVFSESTIHPAEKKEKSSAKKERMVFTPPSVETVTDYCKENGYTVSAWKFVNYYTSNGWLVGKNKMKDWKAAVRTWQSKENENGNRQLPANNQTNPKGYSNYPKGNDAANKRAELANLKQLAGAVLRGTIPQDR